MSLQLPPGYQIRRGSALDKALLLKFIQRTYEEMFPGQDFSHLQKTVEQYFSHDTPLWWVEFDQEDAERDTLQRAILNPGGKENSLLESPNFSYGDSPCPLQDVSQLETVGCLWAGNAIDQIYGDRHAHIFLLYVAPEHRRKGLATALMQHLETWAKQRGDRQIGLQVFQTSTSALNLYQKFGYHTQSLWMTKPL